MLYYHDHDLHSKKYCRDHNIRISQDTQKTLVLSKGTKKYIYKVTYVTNIF